MFQSPGSEPALNPFGGAFLDNWDGGSLDDDLRTMWIIGRVNGTLRINLIELWLITTVFYSSDDNRLDICFKKSAERSCETLASAASPEEADTLMQRLFTAIIDGSASVRLDDAPRPAKRGRG